MTRLTSPHRAVLTATGLALALAVAGCSSSTVTAGTDSTGSTSSTGSTGSTGSTDQALSRAASDITVDQAVLAGARPVTTPSHPTPITVSAIGTPLVVAGSDGRQHVDYDLLVTNVFTAPVTLTQVQVLDGSTPLLTIAGAALGPVTQGNFSQHPVTPAAQIPVSGQVSVEIDVILPKDARVPRTLDHVVGWSVPADAPALSVLDGAPTGQVSGFALDVSRTRAEVISSPLRGEGWWSLQGCCQPNGHRSLRYAIDGSHEIKSEMFAVDWVQLKDGAFFSGDGSANADYAYIGADLLAVARGTVVKVRDGLPDETPQTLPQYVKKGEDYIGNSVVVQIAPDRYAIYGHLEPGSVAVKVGDRVKAGDVVGKLGNSGNSTAAHLHFVVADGPDFLTATSIPFVVDHYTLQGSAVLPTAPGPINVTGPVVAQTRTHPLWESVASFGP